MQDSEVWPGLTVVGMPFAAACRYVASQPWPFPRSLMVGFYAAAAAGSSDAGGVEWLSHEGRMAMMETGLA